jgi:fructose-1,6-bisphosphatase/sedoheptulose 1,7-bisphosphatase-like protein
MSKAAQRRKKVKVLSMGIQNEVIYVCQDCVSKDDVIINTIHGEEITCDVCGATEGELLKGEKR